MEGVDTLQSSTLETKADRIARYKAERRKALAERYGNMEDCTPKYTRRERKAADLSETHSSTGKDVEKLEISESEQSYGRSALRGKVMETVDQRSSETSEDTGGSTEGKPEGHLSCQPETTKSIRISSHSRWVHFYLDLLVLYTYILHVYILILAYTPPIGIHKESGH